MLQEFQQHRWKAKEAISCYTVNSLSSAKELDVTLPRSPSHNKQSVYQQSCKFIVWSWSYLTPKTTFPFLLKKNFYNIFYSCFSFPIQLYACSISLLSLLLFCSPQEIINKKKHTHKKCQKQNETKSLHNYHWVCVGQLLLSMRPTLKCGLIYPWDSIGETELFLWQLVSAVDRFLVG